MFVCASARLHSRHEDDARSVALLSPRGCGTAELATATGPGSALAHPSPRAPVLPQSGGLAAAQGTMTVPASFTLPDRGCLAFFILPCAGNLYLPTDQQLS